MAWLGRFDDFACERLPSNPKNVYERKELKEPPRRQGTMVSNSYNRDGYTRISDISCKVNHVSVIGIIIAKDGPKAVISKKGTGNERHLVSFTVRDSETAFINITCWGGEQYVKILANEIQIGDVVNIQGAQVQTKSNNPADDKFKPSTPSSCQLTIGENQGTILPYSGLDIEDYSYLLQIPTRPSNDYYTLEDILTNGMTLQGEHINILAVVKKIWPAKEIITKTKKTTSKVDVVLCDETCMSFNLTLWDSFVSLAENWVPLETVIFASDVRITYNDYRSAMTASTDSKTIFTVNPDTAEALCIKEYSKTQVSFSPFENTMANFADDGKDPPLESINNIITVRGAQSLMSNAGGTDYGVMYAFLSHFDIDGVEKLHLREICPACHKYVQMESGFVCGNPNCSGGALSLDGIPAVEYSLTVGLSDHTGTLDRCYVPPTIAEELLGMKAHDFRDVHVHERTNIKWNYLFERMKAVVKISSPRVDKQRCFVKLLTLEKANLQDVTSARCDE